LVDVPASFYLKACLIATVFAHLLASAKVLLGRPQGSSKGFSKALREFGSINGWL
jgi:hypothetical protein